MKKLLLLFCGILSIYFLNAQRFHLGISGGLAAYNGDLTEEYYPKHVTNGYIGVSGTYELTDKFWLRGGFTYAVVGGADRFSTKAGNRARNLSFETKVAELSVIGEYHLLNLYKHKFSPYVFGGVAGFHFNPYAYHPVTQEKTFLQPLGTEGQGSPGYQKKYSLTQFAIPLGAGVRVALGENIHIGMEVGFRKLFTDYFDDVSDKYADQTDMLANNGQIAVDMSYRGHEVGGNPAYPAKDAMRGSPRYNDAYYFSGVHVMFRINNGGGGRNRMGCPKVY